MPNKPAPDPTKPLSPRAVDGAVVVKDPPEAAMDLTADAVEIVYTLVTQHPGPAVGEPLAFPAAALLLLLCLLIGGLAAGLRARLRLGEGL